MYRQLELNLRIKPTKRLVREKPESLVEPTATSQIWSMDYARTHPVFLALPRRTHILLEWEGWHINVNWVYGL